MDILSALATAIIIMYAPVLVIYVVILIAAGICYLIDLASEVRK